MTPIKVVIYLFCFTELQCFWSVIFDIFHFICGYFFPMFVQYLAITCSALETGNKVLFLLCFMSVSSVDLSERYIGNGVEESHGF